MNITIPKDVKFIINRFSNNNHKAFMVGGCVRDSLLGKVPKDYDITTSALPEETLSLFDKTIPTGIKHGTITVMINNEPYEVTTFRTDGDYKDNRRPDSVIFVRNIKEDLSRRDFTINALAYNEKDGLIDYFNGISDLKNSIISCVGNPDERFKEDALRMLRAIRFSCQLGFDIKYDTLLAIKNNCKLIKNISPERIRDELCKIIISNNPSLGIQLLEDTNILEEILPDLHKLVKYTPNCNNHNRDVFSHTLKVLSKTSNDLTLRLSALFHDIGKLKTMTFLENGHCYFPGHSRESSIMTKEILSGLAFDNSTISNVCSLIDNHLVLNVDHLPSDGEVKRLLNKVGSHNIYKLLDLQRADVNSLWTPDPFLYKINFISERVDYILNNNEPLTIKDLDINGKILISELNISPGKILGEILSYLLEQVLDNSSLNNKSILLELSKEYLNNKNPD